VFKNVNILNKAITSIAKGLIEIIKLDKTIIILLKNSIIDKNDKFSCI
jgi:hypothetical protein